MSSLSHHTQKMTLHLTSRVYSSVNLGSFIYLQFDYNIIYGKIHNAVVCALGGVASFVQF